MPKYDIVHPVEHDGIRRESGSIDLSPEQAAPLIAVGSISTRGRRSQQSDGKASVHDDAVEDGEHGAL